MVDQPTLMSGTAPNTGTTVNGNYVYDGNLKRVKSIVNGITRYNVYDHKGRLTHVEEGDGNYVSETNYLHGAGMTLARIKDGVFTYMHPDHLGSPQVGTMDDGTVDFNEYYTPFGEALIGHAANDNHSGFTGHIKDADTGLNYMQARYYDPNIGRFLSLDAVGFVGTGDPNQFNRYAYGSNDPVNKIDPDGNDDIFVGGQGDTVFGVVKSYRQSYASKRLGRTTSYRGFDHQRRIVKDLKTAAKNGGPINITCHSRGCAFTMAAIAKSGVAVDNLITVDPVNAGGRGSQVFDGERPENIANWTNVEGSPAEGNDNFSDRIEGIGEAVSGDFDTSGADNQILTTENHAEFPRMFSPSESAFDNSYTETGSRVRKEHD